MHDQALLNRRDFNREIDEVDRLRHENEQMQEKVRTMKVVISYMVAQLAKAEHELHMNF